MARSDVLALLLLSILLDRLLDVDYDNDDDDDILVEDLACVEDLFWHVLKPCFWHVLRTCFLACV